MKKSTRKLLLIDDDPSLLRVLEHQLSQAGYEVKTAENLAGAKQSFLEQTFDVVVTDLALPDGSGIDLLKFIRQTNTQVVIIIITAYGTIDNALEACRQGADDYVTKPFSREQLLFALEKALRTRQIEHENVQLRSELLKNYDFSNIVARSQPMQDLLKMVARVAETESTVLILGESGTGKELIARAIHYNSPRKNGPLVVVNCPSIPDNLLESELFGHVKGAYTGATRDRKGKFEQAEGGTIFLDEIGDLKPELQAKLLRVLQERVIERIGGEKTIEVDVRIVAATNQNLEKLVQEGIFREDLYYRLSVFPIRIPPLRERKQDIPHLVKHFLNKLGPERRYQVTPEAMEILMAYDWPGNVRELENVIERASILSEDGVIGPDILPAHVLQGEHSDLRPHIESSEGLHSLAEIEKEAILRALEKSHGNQTAAAKMLGIPRHVLIYRMKKFGIS